MKDINYFFLHMKDKRDSKNRKIIKVLITFLLIGILSLLILVPLSIQTKIERITRQNQEMSKKLNAKEIKSKKEKLQAIGKEMDELKEKNKAIENLLSKTGKKSSIDEAFLSNIRTSMSERIFLKSLQVKDDKTIIHGVSEQREDIGEFERNLKDKDYFASVLIEEISLKEEFYEFTISLDIKDRED